MSELNIAKEFKKRRPWITKFVINGTEYGGQFDAMNDPRVSQFKEHFPAARTILELGSLEGGHSLSLARYPDVEKVIAVDGRAANIEKSRLVNTLLGTSKVEFVEANLEDVDLSTFGTFDAVYCVGLLYHLPKPWELIAQCARVSPNLFIWTQHAGDKETEVVNGFGGRWFRESGLQDPLSGLSKNSFWPTLDSLKKMLRENGFKTINIIEDNRDHPHGPAVTLTAVV